MTFPEDEARFKPLAAGARKLKSWDFPGIRNAPSAEGNPFGALAPEGGAPTLPRPQPRMRLEPGRRRLVIGAREFAVFGAPGRAGGDPARAALGAAWHE